MTAPRRGEVPGSDPLAARLAAYDAVSAWEEGVAERLPESFAGLGDPRDAALARELAAGAVRWQRLYDNIAARFLRAGNPPPLARALRLACHQLLALDRIPPHAVGETTVELLRARGHPRLTGVANAVVRRLADLRQAERAGDGPLGRLAAGDQPADPGVRHSLPDELVADLAPLIAPGSGLAGSGLAGRSLADLNRVPPLCTRTRAGRTIADSHAILRREDEWTWWSDPRAALSGPVAAGACVVQDRSQGALIELAAPRAGELAIDLCAAPGGKSLALADRGCRVVSADIAAAKLAAMRGPLPCLVAQDGRRPALAAGAFDLVVLDAPCSNSGVVARRPEARWRYDRAHLASLTALQRELIAAAAGLCAPRGRLLYATCSLAPAEDQAIAHGLAGWRVADERLTWPDAWQAGGYAALLVRG